MTCVLGNKTKICFPHYRLLSHYYSAAAVHSTIDSVKYFFFFIFCCCFLLRNSFGGLEPIEPSYAKRRWDEVEEVFFRSMGEISLGWWKINALQCRVGTNRKHAR